MIVQCVPDIAPALLDDLVQKLQGFGLQATEVKTQAGHYLIAPLTKPFDLRRVGNLDGVRDVHRVADAYKLVSRQWKLTPTVVDLGNGVTIGDGGFTLMLGPCSLEGREQITAITGFLHTQGVKVMRGGAFKPRTSPYSFRGLGLEGLKLWSEIARPLGLKIVTEVLDAAQIEAMYPYVDIFQVGARNSQNFTLLDGLGQVDKPVLLKRGMSGTVDELLHSAEYIFSNGNEKILLCERGIRTFEKAYRNVLDINAIALLKEKSHLPVIIDPSHGIGIRRLVGRIALAGLVAGADGAIVEIHPTPECAASDGAQTLNFEETAALLTQIRQIGKAMVSG